MTVCVGPERPDHPDAAALIGELEALLAPEYPDESRHGLSVDQLLAQGVELLVLRDDGVPAACGGLLVVPDDEPPYGEVKRMYVRPAFRGRGHAKRILAQLEERAAVQGIAVLRLETGIHQREAISLYERMGYRMRGRFGPYREDPLSRYLEKRLGAPEISRTSG
ncbi:MAG: GNAT family N-acetyltransferase [Chloroflexota bacterium]